ncbi:MAG TPA: ATP-binding protein [Dissulfurispiraceae bacterium]
MSHHLMDYGPADNHPSGMRERYRMESAETLAEGVAEIFNNILTAIVGCGKILQMRIDKEDPSIKYVEHILAASEKAIHLTQGLLAFSRKQIISPKPDDVNRMIRRIRGLLTRLVGEGRELRLALCDAELTVLAESGQLEQALMNLATNARDAMTGGGVFTIRTERVDPDSRQLKAHGHLGAGACALISVSDTGTGMDGKTRERVFEPFFTTKEPGDFKGLGLSVVYGIIKQHSGFIDLKSELGEGSTFEIYLPLVNSC